MLKSSLFSKMEFPWSRRNHSINTDTSLSKASIIGLGLWFLALLLIFIKVALEPAGEHTVVDSYLLGAERWIDRVKLYSGPGGFIYSPTFALLFTPLTKIPLFWADLIWRLFIMVFYFMACSRLINHFIEYGRKSFLQWLGMFSLIAVPIAFSGFRNGQMNVVIISSMVMISCLLIEKRWNSASLLLALIMSLKPTFIVFFLLSSSLFRPLWIRVPLMLAGFAALPVLFGGWDYGIAQYYNYVEMMESAAHLGLSTPKWASFFNIFMQVIHVQVPHDAQTIIKVILAALTWVTCFYAIVRHGTKTGLVYLLTLAACYHLLFNPRSVNTDYIILGTMTAFWFTSALYLWQDKQLAWVIGLISAGVLFAFDISRLTIPGTSSWFNPLMGFFFLVLVLWQLFQKKRAFAP